MEMDCPIWEVNTFVDKNVKAFRISKKTAAIGVFL